MLQSYQETGTKMDEYTGGQSETIMWLFKKMTQNVFINSAIWLII